MDSRRFPIWLSLSIAIGLALAGTVLVFTEGWSNYSISLFVLTPGFYGLLAALLYGRLCAPQSDDIVMQVLKSAFLPGAIACVVMLFVAAEGMVCLVMAAPLVGGELLLGAAIGTLLHNTLQTRRARTLSMLIAPLLYVGFVAVDHVRGEDDTFHPVTSSMEIAAPPEAVWTNVVAFPDLPPPRHWLFKTSIAYPLRARIVGEGADAVRYCEFTTGPFVEPIEVWDAPNRLRFRVVSNPAPMKELSPWGDIHPPHLDGFMESRQGEFRLVPLPNGHTRLEGTTWYRHGLGPQWYWTLWSDYIIHTIHMRVLTHIKTLSEGK